MFAAPICTKIMHAKRPGLPDFSRHYIPKHEKIYHMTTKCTKWLKYTILQKIPTSFIASPSKIYPNRDFWFDRIKSGNIDNVQRGTAFDNL
jgi:hypothetical protein